MRAGNSLFLLPETEHAQKRRPAAGPLLFANVPSNAQTSTHMTADLNSRRTLDYFLETFEGVTRDQAQAVLRYGGRRIAAELAA